MVNTFVRIFEYCTYALRNKTNTFTADEAMSVFRFKQKINGLHPTLGAFYGNTAIDRLSILSMMRDELEITSGSEAVSLRFIANYLEDDAARWERVSVVFRDRGFREGGFWAV